MDLPLLIKLFASPIMIGLASLAGRRWGPNVAGLMGGLPLVGGPIIAALWIVHGAPYAEQVAIAAPAGVWANIVYMLAVGYASARFGWAISILCGWLGYLSVGLLINLSGLSHSLVFGVAVLPALWFTAVRFLPKPAAPPASVHLPHIELATRMAAAAAIVLLLTGISTLLGPTLTGVFTGAPVAATVIPAFTFANSGRDALLLVLRGFLTGLMGFTVCFAIAAVLIPVIGPWVAFPALGAGIAMGLAATHWARRSA
ncbi:MAG: hypothetical protein JO142_05460 [Burkholderiales bacterium]|nr:hypothetical protein [Burkholderiales bacterium]